MFYDSGHHTYDKALGSAALVAAPCPQSTFSVWAVFMHQTLGLSVLGSEHSSLPTLPLLPTVPSKADAGTSSLFERRSQEAEVGVEESVRGGV